MGYSVLELGHGLPKNFGLGQMRIIVLVKVLVMHQKFQARNFHLLVIANVMREWSVHRRCALTITE